MWQNIFYGTAKCTLSEAISSLGRSHNGLRVSSISPVKYPVRGRPQYRIIEELDLPDLSEILSELSELLVWWPGGGGEPEYVCI